MFSKHFSMLFSRSLPDLAKLFRWCKEWELLCKIFPKHGRNSKSTWEKRKIACCSYTLSLSGVLCKLTQYSIKHQNNTINIKLKSINDAQLERSG